MISLVELDSSDGTEVMMSLLAKRAEFIWITSSIKKYDHKTNDGRNKAKHKEIVRQS